jgi:acyl carrier protein
MTAGVPSQDLVVARLATLLEDVTRGRCGPAASLAADTPLRDLDLDSATLLAFLVAVEEHFGIEWDDEVPEDALARLDSIAAYVRAAIRA